MLIIPDLTDTLTYGRGVVSFILWAYLVARGDLRCCTVVGCLLVLWKNTKAQSSEGPLGHGRRGKKSEGAERQERLRRGGRVYRRRM